MSVPDRDSEPLTLWDPFTEREGPRIMNVGLLPWLVWLPSEASSPRPRSAYRKRGQIGEVCVSSVSLPSRPEFQWDV